MAAFSYYLQYAVGNLRFHLIGNIALASVLIPGIIIAASHFGAKGAGYVWLVLNIAFLFLWVAYIHHKLQPGLHMDWLFKDILIILIPASLIAASFSRVEFELEGRLENIIYVAIFSILIISCSVIFSSVARKFVINKVIYVKKNRK